MFNNKNKYIQHNNINYHNKQANKQVNNKQM